MDSLESDVAPVVRAREVYALHGRVRPLSGLRARVAERRHVEDAAARGQERVLPQGSPRMEDERASPLRVLDTADLDPDLARLRVAPRGEDDRPGARGRDRDLEAREVAGRRGREELEQVALEPRHDRLRLRVAEAAVELEHGAPARGQHQAGIEGAD